ncbi:hypothetical protein AFFFEF_04320 [Methylorubrum extorquens]
MRHSVLLPLSCAPTTKIRFAVPAVTRSLASSQPIDIFLPVNAVT